MLLVAALIALAENSAVRIEVPSERQVALYAEQLLEVAERLERQERFDDARVMLEAMLEDPDPAIRDTARYRLALLDARLGNSAAAIVTLRQLLASNADHLEGRLTLAALLVQGGNEAVALDELRLAMAGNIDPRMRGTVGGAIRHLADRRPFAIGARFALAPDSNISGATDNDILETVIGDFAVSEESKARSGVGAAVGLNARYRQMLGDSSDWTFAASSHADLYQDPQFRRVYAEVTTGPRIRFAHTRLSFGVGAGRYWLGGSPVFDQLQATAVAEQMIGNDWVANLAVTSRLVSQHRNPLEEGVRYRLTGGATHFIDARTGVSAQLSGERAALADPGYANRNWRASLSGFRHVAGVTAGARAEIGGLETDTRLSLFPENRRDRFRRYEISAQARTFSVLGMSPFVSLARERNHSTVAFYDYARTRLEIGVVKID